MAEGKGVEKLGRLLIRQMNNVSGYVSGTPLDLGTITSKRGLKLDSVSYTIPQGDYMVADSATIAANDRVLVALVGTEPIVIDKVVSS